VATILSQDAVCDGYDVRCLLASGATLSWHFLLQPIDVQAAVDALEADYLARLESELEIIDQPPIAPT